MSYKGKFRPRNPLKYKGDPSNIVYRSRWELVLMMRFDAHPDVIQWASEEFTVPYVSPVDGKVHRYFPDFWVKKKNPQGIVEVIVIEVKPAIQTTAPAVQNKKTRRYLTEVRTWGINSAKWKAAREYCADRDWKFIIMTEHDLGLTNESKRISRTTTKKASTRTRRTRVVSGAGSKSS